MLKSRKVIVMLMFLASLAACVALVALGKLDVAALPATLGSLALASASFFAANAHEDAAKAKAGQVVPEVAIKKPPKE